MTNKAVETTGMIDAEHHLVLDEPLDVSGPTRVRVIILMPSDADINEEEWLGAVARNPAFEFLRESAEDVYTVRDGKPFNDQG
jgi:hypothetical protein